MQDYVTKTEFKTSMDDIGQNFKVVFNKLDQVEERFEQIDRRFEAIDLRFNRLDHNIAVIMKHLGIPETQAAI